jgi:phage/plasmid-associated DNA primase
MLLISAESNNNFIKSDAFKSLTGDKMHRMNPKFKKAYYAEIKCMVIFHSNHGPEGTSDDAIRDRIIPCRMQKIKEMENEEDVISKLKEEEEAIVAHCIDTYNKLKDCSGRIPCDQDDFDLYTNEAEMPIQTIIEDCFEITENDNDYITSSDFTRHVKVMTTRKITDRKLRDFLRQRYKITSVQTRVDGKRIPIMRGLNVRTVLGSLITLASNKKISE